MGPELQAHFDGRLEHYLDQPAEVALETLTLCNAACTFCPYPVTERKGERMPDELIDRVITQMSEFTKGFYFSPFKLNEPLLDPRFIGICRRVEAETKAILRIFTNGAPLVQRRIDEIASLDRVDYLWISLNEYRPDEYQELMGIPFEKTAKRLDNLHKQDFPHRVMLSTVGFPNEEFRYYCFERWPDFESIAIQRSGWLGYTHDDAEEVPDTPCGRWFEMSIMSSGVCSLCCMDSDGQFPIGNINDNTLLEIYNAPGWRERREKLLSRREVPVCQTCTY